MSTTAQPRSGSRPTYLTGFSSLDSELELDSLPIEGSIPEWLDGTLLRNGPAKFEAGEQPIAHWFDGLAMLHKFSFAAGRVSYANRFLRTDAYREAEAGRLSYAGFATDPCRSIFKRMATMFRPRFTDNCNVNLAKLGEQYIAMTETPLPVAFDPDTLDTLGVAYEPPGMHVTAHPHHDPERGELLAYATHFGRRSKYRVYAQHDHLQPAHPRRAGGRRALLHAQLRAHRALHRPGRLPPRRQPFAVRDGRAPGPSVHRELRVEARAGHQDPGLRPRRRRARAQL